MFFFFLGGGGGREGGWGEGFGCKVLRVRFNA